MIPRITAGGSSFKGAFRYYLHDKGADTRDRVAWTHTENLLTNDPDKAWRIMAFTAKEHHRLKEFSGQKMTGRKLTKPVFSYSLSWHPEQNPSKNEMLAAGQKTLRLLGLAEYETVIIAHRDEPQRHIHIIVNRVHPLTGIAADTGNSKRKLSDFARQYEREHGKIYCAEREANYRKRQQGEKTMYRDPNITQAWTNSDTGKSFAAALKEKGYELAQGRKRLVIVDPYGQVHNPTRHLENVKAREFQERLKDIDSKALPDGTLLSRNITTRNRHRYEASRKYDQWAANERNHTQDRHIAERAEFAKRTNDQIEHERAKLAVYYKISEQERRIEALRHKGKNPAWWERVFGVAHRNRDRLRKLELAYQNAKSRMQERVGKLEADRERELSKVQARQAKEKEAQLDRIAANRPEGYANETERERLQSYFDQGSRRRSRGPELER